MEERCSMCGEPAAHKVTEEPAINYGTHLPSNYLCEAHFRWVMFSEKPPFVGECSSLVTIHVNTEWLADEVAKRLREEKAREWEPAARPSHLKRES